MNRARRRRHRRHHHHHEDVGISMRFGWCDHEDHLPTVRQHTHDQLIADLGPRRRSAITWTTFTMPEAITILDRLHALDGQDTPDLRALLLEHGGYLVIAHADAADPT